MVARLVLVGGGKMGGALLAGWRDVGGIAAENITVVEPFEGSANALRARHGVTVVDTANDLDGDLQPSLVLFAVKPQVIGNVVGDYRKLAEASGPAPVFLSIAAGTKLALFENALGADAAVVRSMPNTPAAVARGITVACANARVSADQIALCTRLLEAVGEVAWVDDESLMDAVTGVSGSGPAYIFLLIESLAAAGVAAGLAPELSEKLARATVTGAGELAHRSTEPAEILRRNVTSPGGTTAAALAVLMAADDGLEQLMTRAVAAATDRSRELAAD
jgi:pyrroline-5-carboxylate reductase